MREDEMIGLHHQLDGHEFEQAPEVWYWTGKLGVLQFMGLQRDRHDCATELINFTSKKGACTYTHTYRHT